MNDWNIFKCTTVCGGNCAITSVKNDGWTEEKLKGQLCTCSIWKLQENKMNDWKKLQIDNLPPDILTGDYEIEFIFSGEGSWTKSNHQKKWMVIRDLSDGFKYRYRKQEPKQPTINEDLADYLKYEAPQVYGKIMLTREDVETWVSNAFKAGRESADIPPE